MDGLSTPQDDCFLQKDCEIVAAERYLIFATKRWGYFSLQNDGDLTTERLPEDRMATSRGLFFGVAESRQYSGSSPHSILRWFEEHDSYRLGSSITTLKSSKFLFVHFGKMGEDCVKKLMNQHQYPVLFFTKISKEIKICFSQNRTKKSCHSGLTSTI